MYCTSIEVAATEESVHRPFVGGVTGAAPRNPQPGAVSQAEIEWAGGVLGSAS